ncbi:CHAT domain-containing protein [Streptomyces sp. NBC_01003]|uniref:CHAT domain-containing protein n=1 Tax=Streptomyces sp. NBC_01003 TaxID=2903714 RepID=UPI00386C2D0B|nr:CHAT domain-containing protein [Streptomyces sp. NBC_01003]
MAYVSNQQSPHEKERKRREEEERLALQQQVRERSAQRLRDSAGRDTHPDVDSLTAAVEKAKPGTRRWTAAVTALSAELLLRFRQSPEKGVADLVTAIRMLSKADERGPAAHGTGGADTAEERPTTVRQRGPRFARATAAARRFVSRLGADRGVGAGGAEDAARVALLVECLEEWEVVEQVSPPGGWGVDLGRVPDLDVLRRRLAGMAGAPARVRVRALHAQGSALAAADGPGAGYEDMAAAVALLPRTAGWGMNRGQRRPAAEQVANKAEVTADAAACAIAAGRPVEAIELLETGRGVVWDQVLHATIRAEVRAVDRRLARRMDRICRDLERPGRREAPDRFEARDVAAWRTARPDIPSAVVAWLWGLALPLTGKRAARRERQWARSAQRAQGLLPDATFQMASYPGDIRPAAAEGPVVAVVLSRFGCYALLLTAEEDAPDVVPLPALNLRAAQHKARDYLTALNELTGREREARIQATLHWLWETVVAPVVAGLELLGWSGKGEDGELLRLWWCPSGPLALLPLHAAEPQPVEGGTSTGARERAVSSYTPTVRSLISARKARDLRQNSNGQGGNRGERERLLLVSAGGLVGHQALPATARFFDYLTSLLVEDGLTTLHGQQATTGNVKRALGRHSRVHFDCHGRQDPVSPERTGLVLHDQDLTIADLAEVRAERPEFAFLAACSTAAPDHIDLDEMISVTSVLHYRGYQSVIGTMSPVLDRSTERVAMAVYEGLVAHQFDAEPASPLSSTAALLHHAVRQERRRRPRHPSTWVPFIHVGV